MFAFSPRADDAVESSRKHWAFQPVRKPEVTEARGVNPVDGLLGTENLPRADARTLIRRMTCDLTGLPPTPEEVDEFTHEYGKGSSREKGRAAASNLVERLLASPAYGEKWGRKWLDLARYADTAGENTDRPLQHAWRYRNYVIAAYNQDIPYDQFLREQIAGDLLAAAEPQRYAELIPATGYLAIARRFGHEIEKDMHLTHDDVIDTIGKSVLGLSLGCARCHHHKYDPVTTQDYYGLYGIFASTQFAYSGCEATQKVRDMRPLWSPDQLASTRKPFEDELSALDATIKKLNEVQAVAAKALLRLVTNSSSVLAKGEFNDGGAQSFPTNHAPLTLAVKAGEMLLLTVYPRANHGADTTLIEFNVEDVDVGGGGERWNLAADVVDDFLAGNPHADQRGHAATWCLLDARNGWRLLAETVRDHQGKKGLHLWRNGDTPSAFVNSTDQPIKVWTTLPPRSFFVHPAPDGPVAVAWISPVTGTVRITGRVADGHAGGGDGVAWTLEHAAADIGPRMTDLAACAKNLHEPMQRRAELMAREPKVPVAYAVTEGKAADAPLQKRGDPEQPGEIVPRKNLELFGGEKIRDPKTSGRLDLARWLTEPNNPLTARVMVNRLWQGHFGRGIVATPSDFGTRGAAPTHPELLDWLAATFVEQGWSVKAMHRLIMSSAMYGQASGSDDLRSTIDERPGDPLVNRKSDIVNRPGFPRRRLEAEEIRDTLLALSGELDREPGEAHPFPAENTNFTQHNPFKAVYETNKRSVYLMTQRIQRHPFLALFDGPDANASTAERGSSTVPTQSLYFLNDPFFHARAAAFCKRLLAQPEAARVTMAHRLCFQREPSSAERAHAAEFLAAYRAELDDLPEDQRDFAAWSAYARTLLASNELLYVD